MIYKVTEKASSPLQEEYRDPFSHSATSSGVIKMSLQVGEGLGTA